MTPELSAALKLLEPLRLYASPVFLDLDAVPSSGKLLFVGNHTLLGVIDTPLLIGGLAQRKGLLVRSLADHVHFRIPLWGELLSKLGVVDGTRENCDRLMAEGLPILVFPGGGREVAKRKGEKYRLVWKERLGFARMAIRHGYRVVPFGSIGVEDALDVVVDADDILKSPLGPLVRKLGFRPDVLMPLVKGVGPTPLPRPERIYFGFGAPIDTAPFAGADSDENARSLRDEARTAVEAQIARLLAHRETDPQRRLSARVADGWKNRNR